MPIAILSKLYYRSSGDHGSPTWTEINLVGDAQLNVDWDEGDGNARASRVKLMAKTLMSLEFTGKLRKKYDDAGYVAMMQAALADDAVDFLILDGDRTLVGSEGWRFDGQVLAASQDQSLGNVLYRDIRIKPTLSDNPPQAVKVAAGPTLQYATPGGSATFA